MAHARTANMQVSNDCAADSGRCRSRLAAEGYLFFRSILSRAAVERLRRGMVEVLVEEGYAEPEGPNAIWTGKPVAAGSSGRSARALKQRYDDRNLASDFVDTPVIRSMIETLMGEPVTFVPLHEYRNRPPGDEPTAWHQDGYASRGIIQWTAWIPLMPIDRRLGGLELAAGLHRQGYLQQSSSFIPEASIPAERRRSADFEPGDLVIFSESTPHTGLPNTAGDGSLRLSVDVRFRSAAQPELRMGTLQEFGPSSVTIDDRNEGSTVLRVDAETSLQSPYVYSLTFDGSEIMQWDMPKGYPVIVSTAEDDLAVLVIPAFYSFHDA